MKQRVLSRRVILRNDDEILLDVESCFLYQHNVLKEIIHPTPGQIGVLIGGIYRLDLGEVRFIDLETE